MGFNKNKIIADILACPICHKGVELDSGVIFCSHCSKKFESRKGIPILFPGKPISDLSGEPSAHGSFKEKFRNTPIYPIVKSLSRLSPPDSSFVRRKSLDKQSSPSSIYVRKFVRSLGRDALILDLGSDSRRISQEIIGLDIDLFSGVDVVGDAEALPFKNNSFDAVIIQDVLEHIPYPDKVASEIHRVLKKGGKVYADTPFIQVYHGSPKDYRRFTYEGHETLFNKFKTVSLGVSTGPSSTFALTLRYYLATLFSFNSSLLFTLWLNVFGWVTFPIKYLDFFLNDHKKAYLMASSTYYIGKKI